MDTKLRIKLGFAFRSECQQEVERAKLSYLKNLGNKVNDPDTLIFLKRYIGKLSIK